MVIIIVNLLFLCNIVSVNKNCLPNDINVLSTILKVYTLLVYDYINHTI